MIIKKIEKLKNNRYKILFDNEYITTFEDVIIDNNLLYNKEISEELYNKMIKDTEFYNIYDKVIKYILKKRRSEFEIKQYLNKFSLESEEHYRIITKLKNSNLINDSEYCKAFINDSIYLSNKGLNKIKSELMNQNISIKIIEEELKNVDIEYLNNKLEKLIQKKINLNKNYSQVYLKQKILKDLLNLGYERDKIIELINSNKMEDADILKREFNKIYKKLLNKYSSYELYNLIRKRLLIKGFNINEIDELINKKTEE